MKKIVLLWLGLLIFGGSFAQVNFRDITIEEALEAAKKEGKLVFVDWNAPWCTGCKIIDAEFKDDTDFAKIMNNLCVCIKVDVETEYGKSVKKKYPIRVLPTFLFLKPDGSIQHVEYGGTFLDLFVNKFWRGINPYTCYSYLKAKYDAGERGFEFLNQYCSYLRETENYEELKPIMEELWNNCSDKEKIANFGLFYRDGAKEGSKEWEFLLANVDAFRARHGKRIDKILQTPIETNLNQIMSQDSVWSKKELKKLEKRAKELGNIDQNLRLRFDISYAICANDDKAVLKIVKANADYIKGLVEFDRVPLLNSCAKTAKEPKVIAEWLEFLKQEILPNLYDGPFGRKKSMVKTVKALEEKL